MEITWLSHFTWQLHGNSKICTWQTKAMNLFMFLVNLHVNFQAKPKFVHGENLAIKFTKSILFNFFKNLANIFVYFQKKNVESINKQSKFMAVDRFWLKIPTWQRCPVFRRLTWQLKIFWWQPWWCLLSNDASDIHTSSNSIAMFIWAMDRAQIR